MRPTAITVVIAGGGTGGHLYPALAIADEIVRTKPDASITFVGTKEKLEARVVPARGYAFVAIWISGLRRTAAAENLLFPLKVLVALCQSFALLRRLKPDVVVGTGGYVCGPVVFAASVMGIPTLIQEQNSYPGLTTRLLASRATQVHLTFPSSGRYLRRTDNVKVSGNPTRATIGSVRRADGAAYFDLEPARKTLLVFGGSLGASSLNQAVMGILPDLRGLGLQLVWQTGEKDFPPVQSGIKRLPEQHRLGIAVRQFIDQMEYAYAAADLVLCRAGATTLAEVTRAGIPSILVPYPHAAADHQTENAKAMVAGNASVLIADSELRARLLPILRELVSNETLLSEMARSARSLGKPYAAADLARAVLELIGKHDNRTGEGL